LQLMHDGLVHPHVFKIATDVGDHVVNDEPVDGGLWQKVISIGIGGQNRVQGKSRKHRKEGEGHTTVLLAIVVFLCCQ